MKKSKLELYEENKKLRDILKTYSKFWETDAIEELTKQNNITKKIIYGVSFIFILITVFLLGLAN